MGWFVVILLLVIALAVLAIYAQAKRRKEFMAVAARLGFTYSVRDPFDLVAMPFRLFRKGDGRGIENVLSGVHADREVKLFDYWYYEETHNPKGGTSRSYSRFSCAVTPIDARTPHVSIGREGVFSRLADHLGMRDLEFESEEFNRMFQVEAADRKAAYALVDARMMEWLMKSEKRSFEVHDGYLLAFTGRLKPLQVPVLLETLDAFCAHVPAVLADLYPGSREEEAR